MIGELCHPKFKRSIRPDYLVYVLVVVLFVSVSFAQVKVLYKISEVVGDTIDLAERNQYSLFPAIEDFISARFLVNADSVYIAEVNYGNKDSIKILRLRLMSREVERIKFIIEHPELIEQQAKQDTETVIAVFDRFWSTIEARRIPDSVDVAPRSKKSDRVTWIIRGTTVGAAIGHLTATAVVSGIPGEMRIPPTEEIGCFGARCCAEQQFGCGELVPSPKPIYMINLGVYYIVTSLITGAGTVGGYLLGEMGSKKPSVNILKVERTKKGTVIRVLTWIFSPMIAVGAINALGYMSKSILDSSEDKKAVDLIEIALPVGIVGFGVTFEFVRLGYRIANAVDRHEALRKARRP